MQPHLRTRTRRSPDRQNPADDSWVDRVADSVKALLAEEGLDMELIVWYDAITEQVHAVGFDGAPARYLAALSRREEPQAAADPSASLETAV